MKRSPCPLVCDTEPKVACIIEPFGLVVEFKKKIKNRRKGVLVPEKCKTSEVLFCFVFD